MARIAFRSLLSIEVRHQFHGGVCDALLFSIPAATERQLAGAHLLLRQLDGRLHLLCEVDEAEQPLAELEGLRLLIGLRPREVSFDLVTPPLGLAAGETAVWDNLANAGALAGPRGVTISGERLRITPRQSARPLTLRLIDPDGQLAAQTQLNPGDEAWTPMLLPGRGAWRVEEKAAGPAQSWALWVAPELVGAWGALQIDIAAAQLQAPPALHLDFAARSDTLRYYVVAQRYGAAEFSQLQVVDAGFVAEARPEIVFKRLAPTQFDASHLAPALLDATGSARIALFETEAAVARRERGPGGLELHRNGDVLVGNLPQPGAERHDAQFVVHLSLS